MVKELTTNQKKGYAELLFMQNQLTQKEIALKVGVSEKTLSKWANDNHWDEKRKSMLLRKEELLRFFYEVLDNVRTKIKEGGGIGDSKMADMVVKYATAIRTLETDTSISSLMDAGQQFHKYMQAIDPAAALEFLNNYDGFIKEKIKKF